MLDRVFLGDPSSNGCCASRLAERTARADRVRHGRQLARLAPHRRPVHATDATNASRTLLYDIDRSMERRAVRVFGVPRRMLPEVRRSRADFGVAHAEFLRRRLPIRGVAGDQQAALFGHGCWVQHGKNTYGTGAFLLRFLGTVRPRRRAGMLTTIACDAAGGPAYALEASVFVAGAAVQWLRDGLGIIEHATETEALARASLDARRRVLCAGAHRAGRAHWEPDARGTIVGLTRGSAGPTSCGPRSRRWPTRPPTCSAMARRAAEFARLRVDGGATAERLVDAVPGRHARRSGRAPRPRVEATAFGAAGSRRACRRSLAYRRRVFSAQWAFTSFEPRALAKPPRRAGGGGVGPSGAGGPRPS